MVACVWARTCGLVYISVDKGPPINCMQLLGLYGRSGALFYTKEPLSTTKMQLQLHKVL